MPVKELTDIARKLKEIFPGFEANGLQEEVDQFRNIYRDAESIRIGEMDYIVINDVYKSEDVDKVPDDTSSLFYSSIHNTYAIIDAETSSTLIDEVYSRITYMQRDCTASSEMPDSSDIESSLKCLVGDGESLTRALVLKNADEAQAIQSKNKANIFQCQLIKDTGVSASPDVYSFMLKDGGIKEIADSAIRQIKNSGIVKMLDETNVEELKNNEEKIQEAVFNKYINSDIDIQSVTVKSIFEIQMEFCNVKLFLEGKIGKDKRVSSVFNTSYLVSKDKEFEALNANIHVCNTCKNDLVDIRDESRINKLHANLDVYDEKATAELYHGEIPKGELDKIVYATGCEDCLEQCPCCGGWHFNYKKLAGVQDYKGLKFVPGRSFVTGISSFDINYCSCRENIEWVYDECSGEREHDVIPLKEMAFINYANEKLSDYAEYEKFYTKRKGNKKLDGLEEKNFAKDTMNDFKQRIADKFDIDIDGISITSNDKCHTCSLCGGQYYGNLKNGRCAVCAEMFEENRHMLTRVDGMVFMRNQRGGKRYINKYVVTKLGNLKLVSSKSIASSNDEDNNEEA